MANIPFNNNVTQFLGSGLGQPQAGAGGAPGGGSNPMMDLLSKIMPQGGGGGGSPFSSLFSKMMPQGGAQTLPQMPNMGASSPPPWLQGGSQVSTSPLIDQHNSVRPPMQRGMNLMNGIFGAK